MAKHRDNLIDFAIFSSGRELYGYADVTLPDIEFISDTIKGAGIAGEVDLGVLGQTKAMNMSIKWNTIDKDVTDLASQKVHDIEIRGAQQLYDSAKGELVPEAVSVYAKVMPKKIGLGKFEQASKTDTSTEFEIVYFKMTVGGKTRTEIDKFNYVCVINGVDYLASVREALGK